MEIKIGRNLSKEEHVHHIDGDRMNNSLDNLEIVNGRKHNAEHTRERNYARSRVGDFVCGNCGRKDVVNGGFGLCKSCYHKQRVREKAKRPCYLCGKETQKGKIYSGLCASCAMKTWNHCRICQRTRKELEKLKGHPHINANGLCRACQARINKQQKKIDKENEQKSNN